MTDSTRARRVLSDTSRCPKGFRCESCGTELLELSVVPIRCDLGTMCLTMCSTCAASTVEPPVTVWTAQRLVAAHEMHVAAPRRKPPRKVAPPSGILRRDIEVPWP